MEFSFNYYAITLLYCGIITLFISYYVYTRDKGAIRWIGLMMFSNAIWSVSYGLELASTTLDQIKIFIAWEYIGIISLPITWFFFCLKMAGKDCWYHKPVNVLAILLIPVLTLLGVWTDSYHHIYYKDLKISNTGKFPMAVIVPGIGYRVFTLYFYCLLGIGNYLLISNLKKADPTYRKQNYTIIIASLIPWVANFLYLLGIRPLANLDLTPFAFILAILLISLAIYRFRLFDVLPVAREKVLELIQDGFMLLDHQQRIIDYNNSIHPYLIRTKKIIGKGVKELLPDQPELYQFLEGKKSGKLDIKINSHSGSFDLEADIRYLNDNQFNSEIVIIKFQDQTERKRELLKNQQQTEELQKLNQLKDKIFSIIAHDLRAPLVNLSEILKMISSDSISPEEFKQIAPTLSRDIIYTTDLLENILHWSRSQLKGYGIRKENFNLRNLILNEIDYHLPAASIKKIKIIHDVYPNVIVHADILMVQIVVRNILNNAIKFSNLGDEVTISANYDLSGYVYLYIQDMGIGMHEENTETAFDGANISLRGTMNEKGTGLGLMVCKEFMERNDGNISVKSKLGEGTTFTILIPTKPDIHL